MSNQFPETPKSVEVNHVIDHIKNIEVKHLNDSIIIIKKWQDAASILFLTVCSLFGNLISLTGFFGFLLDFSLGGFLIVLPFCLGTLFLLYYTIAIWVNRTYITVNDKAIVVRHEPIPLPTCHNIILRLVKLENLYLKSQKTKTQHGTNTTYQLLARTSNNTDKKLLNFTNIDEALFVEKTLKDYLNLKDETQEELGRAD